MCKESNVWFITGRMVTVSLPGSSHRHTLAQFTLVIIRVATRPPTPPAHLSWSAFGQLSQVGQKRSGGSVHPSSMDLVTYVGLDSLPHLFRVARCFSFVRRFPVLGGTDRQLTLGRDREHRAN
jgi:hypothetical protein